MEFHSSSSRNMKSACRNSLTPSSETRLSLSVLSHNSCLRCDSFVKNTCNEFSKNLSNAGTGSQKEGWRDRWTDGRGMRIKPSILQRKRHQIFSDHLTYCVIKGGTKKRRVALDTCILCQTSNSKGPSEETERV